MEILKTTGAVAGLAGLAIGLIVIIFRSIIAKKIFPKLTQEQAYKTLRLIIVLSFLIAALGISAWVVVQPSQTQIPPLPSKQKLTIFLDSAEWDLVQVDVPDLGFAGRTNDVGQIEIPIGDDKKTVAIKIDQRFVKTLTGGITEDSIYLENYRITEIGGKVVDGGGNLLKNALIVTVHNDSIIVNGLGRFSKRVKAKFNQLHINADIIKGTRIKQVFIEVDQTNQQLTF